MSTDESGNYTLPSADIVNGQTGDATPVQANFDDIESALTARLTKNGVTTPTANLPMGGFKFTGLGQGSAATDSVNKGQMDAATVPLTTAGTSAAYTLTYSPAVGALADGMVHMVQFHAANANAPTLNVNGLGAKPIQYYSVGAWRAVPVALWGADWIAPVTYNLSADAYRLIGFDNRTGIIEDFGGGTAPAGTILAYGQAISRTAFAGLFAAYGTTHGVGDGTSTFNVLDFRGRSGAGKDDMGGSSANRITTAIAGFDGDTLGAAGGSEAAQLLQHNHGVTDPTHFHSIGISNQSLGGTGSGNVLQAESTMNTDASATGITIDNEGDANAHNVQPTIIVNKVIRI